MKHLFALLLLLPASLVAQTNQDFERVLIPTIVEPTPGGFGSLWTTRLLIFNGGSQHVQVEYPFACIITCPSSFPIEPRVPKELPGLTPPPLEAPGLLIYVLRPFNEEVSFNLRAQDLSRQALTWGTEIPVIREGEAHTGTIHLLNIPLDERFRQNIRFYGLDARNGSMVRVRYYSMTDHRLLAEQELTLVTPRFTNPPPRPQYPAYAIVPDVAAIPGVNTAERVRAEITPLTEGLEYWAFASITNNETQHITIITPQ